MSMVMSRLCRIFIIYSQMTISKWVWWIDKPINIKWVEHQIIGLTLTSVFSNAYPVAPCIWHAPCNIKKWSHDNLTYMHCLGAISYLVLKWYERQHLFPYYILQLPLMDLVCPTVKWKLLHNGRGCTSDANVQITLSQLSEKLVTRNYLFVTL